MHFSLILQSKILLCLDDNISGKPDDFSYLGRNFKNFRVQKLMRKLDP
jgi:hypothetical protein